MESIETKVTVNVTLNLSGKEAILIKDVLGNLCINWYIENGMTEEDGRMGERLYSLLNRELPNEK